MNDLIYDHYKETCEIQRANEVKRNKLFIYICLVFLILMLITRYPNSIYLNLQDLVFNQFGVNLQLQLSIIETSFWAFAFYFIITYYQVNANIEKTYLYIHKLEKHLKNISRESSNYLKIYPLFQNIAFIFYKYIFPFALCICVTVGFINTINTQLNFIILIFRLALFILIMIINISYMYFNFSINRKEKNYEKAKNMR